MDDVDRAIATLATKLKVMLINEYWDESMVSRRAKAALTARALLLSMLMGADVVLLMMAVHSTRNRCC